VPSFGILPIAVAALTVAIRTTSSSEKPSGGGEAVDEAAAVDAIVHLFFLLRLGWRCAAHRGGRGQRGQAERGGNGNEERRVVTIVIEAVGHKPE